MEEFLKELQAELRAGKSAKDEKAVRRYIPKADGRERPLGIPDGVRDQVVQAAARIVLNRSSRRTSV